MPDAAVAKSSSSMSEHELRQELNAIIEVLKTVGRPQSSSTQSPQAKGQRDTWEERLTALAQLQRFAEENLSARPVFAQLLSSHLKVPFLDQLQDKRSSVVRAACRVVDAFASRSTGSVIWSSMCVWLVPPILALTANSLKLVSACADHTLRAMASSGGIGPESLGALLKGCRARHAAVRYHAASALLLMLRLAKGTPQQLMLSQFTQPLSRVIVTGAADADPKVRAVCRQCYWGLYAMEPGAAAQTFALLDAPTRALVLRDKAESLCAIGAIETVRADDLAVADRQNASARPNTLYRLQAQREEQHAAWRRSNESLEQHTGQPIDQTLALHDELQAVTAARVRSAAPLYRDRVQKGPGAPGGRAFRGEVSADGSSDSLAVDSARCDGGATAADSAAAELPALSVAVQSDRMTDLQWRALKSTLSNPDWAARLDALNALNGSIDRFEGAMLQEAVEALVRRLCDPHFRVCSAALECLTAFLEPTLAPLLEAHLHDLFLALLVDRNSRREELRAEAWSVLQRLTQLFNVKTVLRSLLQCLDDGTAPAVRVSAFEALTALFDVYPQSFSDLLLCAPTLRSMVHQLQAVPEKTRVGNPVWPAGTNAVRVLRRASGECFAKAMATLDGTQKNLVRSVVGEGVTADSTSPRRCSRASSRRRGSSARRPDTENGTTAATGADTDGTVPAGSHADCGSGPPSPSQHVGGLPSTYPHALQVSERSPLLARSAQRSPRYSPPMRSRQLNVWSGVHTSGLFPSDFAVANFTDPHEPASAAYSPCARGDEWADDGQATHERGSGPRRALLSGELIAGSVPLMRGHTLHSDPPMSTIEWPCGSELSPHLLSLSTSELVGRLLDGACTTSAELCTTLEATRESLVRRKERCSEADLQRFLAVLFERLCPESAQPQHTVRRRAFSVLRAVLELPTMRPAVARQLSRIIRTCRAGFDDAYFEVQQEASLTLHTALLLCGLPVDLCLNGLAGVLEVWQRSQSRDDCTRGWLEVLREVGRTFERVRRAEQRRTNRIAAEFIMTESVLSRTTRVVCWCAEHCAAEVRRIAILIFVSVWAALGPSAFPFLTVLSATQRKLVSVYYNKMLLSEQPNSLGQTDAMMRELLSPSGTTGHGAKTRYHDLSAEMRSRGFGEPSTM